MLKKWLLSLSGLLFLSSSVCFATVLPSDSKHILFNLYQKYKHYNAGKVAEGFVVDPNAFSIAIVTVDGEVQTMGDSNIRFPVLDVLKAVDPSSKAPAFMTTAQLAARGAALANNGINPLNHKEIMRREEARTLLSQLSQEGIYNHVGVRLGNMGMPLKAGNSGVILAIFPNKLAIAVYSPLIDDSGLSLRGQKVITDLSDHWRLHMLSSSRVFLFPWQFSMTKYSHYIMKVAEYFNHHDPIKKTI